MINNPDPVIGFLLLPGQFVVTEPEKPKPTGVSGRSLVLFFKKGRHQREGSLGTSQTGAGLQNEHDEQIDITC
jgi:hypothetical protein